MQRGIQMDCTKNKGGKTTKSKWTLAKPKKGVKETLEKAFCHLSIKKFQKTEQATKLVSSNLK